MISASPHWPVIELTEFHHERARFCRSPRQEGRGDVGAICSSRGWQQRKEEAGGFGALGEGVELCGNVCNEFANHVGGGSAMRGEMRIVDSCWELSVVEMFSRGCSEIWLESLSPFLCISLYAGRGKP